jgi:uncharacterized protein YjbJ (UPF0337 family)
LRAISGCTALSIDLVNLSKPPLLPLRRSQALVSRWHRTLARESYVNKQEHAVDKDRIEGSAKVIKGSAKEAIGKVTGDTKLANEGKADKVEGKVQNAIGGVKDVVRDALKK